MATQTNKEKFCGGLAKVLKEQWQVDLRLKAGDSNDDGSAISVHKVILASRSDVFRMMLESDEVKAPAKQVETVTLSEMRQEELEAFVDFMYSDGSKISPKVKQHVRSLYLAADKYEILHLRDLCRTEMVASLKLSNALALLELAQIPFDKDLNDPVLKYVRRNIVMITKSDEFKLFEARNPNLAAEMGYVSSKILESVKSINPFDLL